ncbi:restriction endonuclease subunit S [Dongia sp.]|uniref:restriction endonuclease subunit S n=1 Tax=Dongia sp. TaxID=1977262 RepID=UPI0035AECF55
MTVILPEGWDRAELGAIVTLRSGGTPSRATANFWNGEIPWISAKDLKSFDLKDSIEHLTAIGAEELNVVPAGTILILVRGMGLFKDFPVGVTSRAMAFNQDVKALHPISGVNARFLAHTLVAMRSAVMGRVDRAGHGTGRLATDHLIALPVILAPVPEQQRIVAVLDAWDQAINQTGCLIAAKQRRKAALFQKLFENLPKRPLLEAADVWFSGVDKKTRAGEAAVRLCNYMDVFHNSRITSKLDFMHATASPHQIAVNSLHKHDVVFTKDSETSEEIAQPALIAEDIDNLVCGYHLAIARPREGVGHGPFIAQAMRHPAIRWQFSRLANGVVRFGLTLEAIEQAEIFLPSIDAQKRIAAILDVEDMMIEDLAARAELYRTQKLGLMQKLLTGTWRLDERFEPNALMTSNVLPGGTA